MKAIPILALAGLLMAGCESEIPITGHPRLGEAVRANMAAQIIPVPPSPQAGMPIEVPAERTADAVDRYLKGNVKPLRTDHTTLLK